MYMIVLTGEGIKLIDIEVKSMEEISVLRYMSISMGGVWEVLRYVKREVIEL